MQQDCEGVYELKLRNKETDQSFLLQQRNPLCLLIDLTLAKWNPSFQTSDTPIPPTARSAAAPTFSSVIDSLLDVEELDVGVVAAVASRVWL